MVTALDAHTIVIPTVTVRGINSLNLRVLIIKSLQAQPWKAYKKDAVLKDKHLLSVNQWNSDVIFQAANKLANHWP